MIKRTLFALPLLLTGCTGDNPQYISPDVSSQDMQISTIEDLSSEADLADTDTIPAVNDGSLEDLNSESDLVDIDANPVVDDGSLEDLVSQADLTEVPDSQQSPDLIQLCYQNDFSDPKTINNFQVETGNWVINNGILLQNAGLAGDRIASLRDYNFKDFNLTVKSRVLNDPDGYSRYENCIEGIVFRHKIGANEGYSLEFANGNAGATAYDVRLRNLANNNILFTKRVAGDLRNFYKYGVTAVGNKFTIIYEGNPVGEVVDNSFSEGKVGFLNNHGHYEYDDLNVCGQ